MFTNNPAPRRSRLFPDMHKRRSSYEPGIIELKLREDIRPQVIAQGEKRKSKPRLISLNNKNLDTLHNLLDRSGAHKVEQVVPISHEQADEIAAQTRAKGLKTDHLTHLLRVHVPTNVDVERLAAEFAKLPEVERASPAGQPIRCALPNDPYLGVADTVKPTTKEMEDQWYIYRCNVNQAWSTVTGDTVAISVIDSGFFDTHEDLVPNIQLKFNAVSNNSTLIAPPLGEILHGTATAGLAAAAGNNGIGMTGVAYGAKLWLVQTSQKLAAGQAETWRIPASFTWVLGQNQANVRRVISISIGKSAEPGPDACLDTDPNYLGSINNALAANIPVCISAGNARANGDTRDVSYNTSGVFVGGADDAIIVGATSYDGSKNNRASFSNWGSRVTVCAPGDPSHDLTCYPYTATSTVHYRNRFGGTSGSAPKVAGTVALMLEANSLLSVQQIKAILNGSGTQRTEEDFEKPIGPLLNASAAVNQATTHDLGPKLVANRFLNFCAIAKGSSSTPLKVNLHNIGTEALNLTSLTQKSGSTDFAITKQPSFPSPLAPDPIATHGPAPVTFEITFSPTSRGDQTATFELATDVPNSSPLEVICTGTTPSHLKFWILVILAIVVGVALGVVGILALLGKL